MAVSILPRHKKLIDMSIRLLAFCRNFCQEKSGQKWKDKSGRIDRPTAGQYSNLLKERRAESIEQKKSRSPFREGPGKRVLGYVLGKKLPKELSGQTQVSHQSVVLIPNLSLPVEGIRPAPQGDQAVFGINSVVR